MKHFTYNGEVLNLREPEENQAVIVVKPIRLERIEAGQEFFDADLMDACLGAKSETKQVI